MPLIKEQAETFEELAPFVKMTVAPNGTTVGDLAFVSAQTHWSTSLITIGTANRVPGDLSADLFQSAIGDVGQGFTTSLTRTETSWLDSSGRLPANQVFVAVECAFQVFTRDSASTTATTPKTNLIRNVAAVEAIGTNLTWEVTVGDGITRTQGSIGAYGGLGGVTGGLPLAGASLAAAASAAGGGVTGFANIPALQGAQGVQLGDPCIAGVKLRVPLVFPPNINVRIRVRNGNAFDVQKYGNGAFTVPVLQDTLPTSAFLAVRQYLRGYLCTMPV